MLLAYVKDQAKKVGQPVAAQPHRACWLTQPADF